MKADRLTFRLADEDTFPVPHQLLKSKLSLAEIGALVALISMAHGGADFTAAVFHDPALIEASRSLKAMGVIVTSAEAGTLSITIDLQKLPSAQ